MTVEFPWHLGTETSWFAGLCQGSTPEVTAGSWGGFHGMSTLNFACLVVPSRIRVGTNPRLPREVELEFARRWKRKTPNRPTDRHDPRLPPAPRARKHPHDDLCPKLGSSGSHSFAKHSANEGDPPCGHPPPSPLTHVRCCAANGAGPTTARPPMSTRCSARASQAPAPAPHQQSRYSPPSKSKAPGLK